MRSYQDYIIKDGKFIGKFEEMYQLFDDPWNQQEKGNFDDLSRQIVIHYINTNKINSCIEFGCGLGKTMDFIKSNTNIEIMGIDISKTSINKAKKAYPELSFHVDNVKNIIKYAKYDCFFFSEISWYLLEDNLLDKVFMNMKNNLKNKYFIHNLVFYKSKQTYGNNYFTNLEEFIDFCPFDLICNVEIDNANSETINTSCLFKI